ncbi:hypothetical protein MED222_05230 [Vibrio sp. MED222]|nr:hypothetical protein MED222_05230 [Vibrio sp. MED222]
MTDIVSVCVKSIKISEHDIAFYLAWLFNS